jgi:hypothetical protein
MAILVIFTGDTTKDQYEALRTEVRWETNQPPGAVFHAASFDEAGHIHVADVWESPETMNAFVGQRLVPAFQKLGLTPPHVEVYPAHNVNAYKSIGQYKI